ncbi:deoxyribonuclease-1-like [Gigantopelta aegis]|uniref:deoxyribonuclease-1-like n=1 Tax=Gigantopelta aegis TaxID=1735272 RepID=UPI001B88DBE9|nr:deoxyribonuclease-1-like [Gigantopelta aegis]
MCIMSSVNTITALCLLAMVVCVAGHYKIAAFNIQTFGRAKMDKPDVVNIIKQIVLRYDIILIQEIRDSSGNSLKVLNNTLNTQEHFSYTLSPRLGRSSNYKEQYAYFYRTDRVNLVATHLYDDNTPADVFEREPYCTLFEIPEPAPWKLALVGLHSKPDDAVEEIGYLNVVDAEVEAEFNTTNILFLGDLNAACNYASAAELSHTEIFTNSDYSVLISRSKDTTTKSSTCAYDRIIAKGSRLKSAIVSAGVFDFKSAYSLTQQETVVVSDHFPVEITLSSSL